jgi:hypothetical protein
MADIERVTEVLYLFKGAIGLSYRNSPSLVCFENVFKILWCSPTQMFMVSQLVKDCKEYGPHPEGHRSPLSI